MIPNLCLWTSQKVIIWHSPECLKPEKLFFNSFEISFWSRMYFLKIHSEVHTGHHKAKESPKKTFQINHFLPSSALHIKTCVCSLVVWIVNKMSNDICFVDMVTPGSRHHHCKEISICKFLYSEPFHIKPLWMTHVHISEILKYRWIFPLSLCI